MLVDQLNALIDSMMNAVIVDIQSALNEHKVTKHIQAKCSKSRAKYILLLAIRRWTNEAIRNMASELVIQNHNS